MPKKKRNNRNNVRSEKKTETSASGLTGPAPSGAPPQSEWVDSPILVCKSFFSLTHTVHILTLVSKSVLI